MAALSPRRSTLGQFQRTTLGVRKMSGGVGICAIAQTGGPIAMNSNDGITWDDSGGTTANTWQSLCWASGLSLFVAVGTSAVMTSPDGTVWTARSDIGGGTNTWFSVCYAPSLGLLCAVQQTTGGAGCIMTSPDGITWTSRTPPGLSWTPNAICWSTDLSLFCVVGNPDGVMTSPDGITWTVRAPAVESNDWFSVCWASSISKFVAVASSGTHKVMTSADGITWNMRTGSAFSKAICWSPDIPLLASISSSTVITTSADGITWSSVTVSSGTWSAICYSHNLGLFIVVGSAGSNRVLTSPDGVTWTARVGSTSRPWIAVAANG